jgi:hypothetical protein
MSLGFIPNQLPYYTRNDFSSVPIQSINFRGGRPTPTTKPSNISIQNPTYDPSEPPPPIPTTDPPIPTTEPPPTTQPPLPPPTTVQPPPIATEPTLPPPIIPTVTTKGPVSQEFIPPPRKIEQFYGLGFDPYKAGFTR